MKKLLIILSFLVSFIYSFGQSKIIRSSASNTVFDQRIGAIKNLIAPVYNDTTTANISLNIGIDSSGALIYTRDIMGYWYRGHSPKRWIALASVPSVSGNFIINQFAAAQNANAWIANNFRVDGYTQISTAGRILNDGGKVSITDLNSIPTGADLRIKKLLFYNDNAPSTHGSGIEVYGNANNTLALKAPVIAFIGPTWSAAQQITFNLGNARPFIIGNETEGTNGDIWDVLNIYNAGDLDAPIMRGTRSDIGFSSYINVPGRVTIAKIGSELIDTTSTAYKGNLVFYTSNATVSSGTPQEYMRISSLGELKLSAYPSTRNNGVLSKVLGTDATGNVILGTVASGGTAVIPPNIGTGSRIFSPQIPGFKTLQNSYGLTWDSLTANSLTPRIDSALWATQSDIAGIGSTNTSIGAGYKVAVNNTNLIKSIVGSNTIIPDSLVAGQIRLNADTSVLATQSDIAGLSFNNTSIGGAIKVAVNGTNLIKSVIGSNTILIDSLVSGQIRFKGDTSVLATQSDLASIPIGWSLTGNALTAGTHFLGATNNVSLRFRTNNLERAILDSTGKFAIGTSTALAKFHVAGSSYLTDSLTLLNVLTGTSSDSLLVKTAPGLVKKISQSSLGIPLSSITAAIAPNTINNAGHPQVFNWSALVGGATGLTLGNTGTAGTVLQVTGTSRFTDSLTLLKVLTGTYSDSFVVKTPQGLFKKIAADTGSVSARTYGIKSDGTDQATLINSLLAISGVKQVYMDVGGDVSFNGRINVPTGKTIRFSNDTKLKSNGGSNDTLSGGIISADIRKQVFDTTLTVIDLENSELSAMWFGAKPDAVFLGPTPTNNLTPAKKAIAAGKTGCKIRFPGMVTQETFGYWYSFSSPLQITRRVELYGDGEANTVFLFPGSGAGVWITANLCYIHDLQIRGQYGQVSTPNINSSTAHGLYLNSAQNISERITVRCFDGDGFRIEGNVLLGTNANLNRVIDCSSFGNGGSGLLTNGGDANAGYIENFNAITNARYGIWESSFLGNTYVNFHLATNSHGHNYNKTVVRYKAAVSNGGNRYRVLLASTNVEPGVTAGWATYWTLIGAGGVDATYQAWSSVKAYAAPTMYWAYDDNIGVEPTVTSGWATYWTAFPSGSFSNEWFATQQYLGGGSAYVDNANNRSVFLGCYIELDQTNLRNGLASMVLGGFASAGGTYDGSIAANISGLIATRFQLFSTVPNMTPLSLKKPSVGPNYFITMTNQTDSGRIMIGGLASTGFEPLINLVPDGAIWNSSIISANGRDTSTEAALIFRAQEYAPGFLVTKPLFNFQNYTTSVLKIAANGQLTNSFLVGTGNRILQTSSTGAISATSIDPATIGTGGGTPLANFYLKDSTLSSTRTVSTGGFTTIFTGANSSDIITATNTSTGAGIKANSISGNAVFGSATTGVAGQFNTLTGTAALQAASVSTKAAILSNNPTSTNTIVTLVDIIRGVNGTAANGVGASIDFYVATSTGTNPITGQVILKWTTATHATRTSEVDIMGVNSAATETYMNIQHNLVRINNNVDTLATRSYARSVGGGSGGGGSTDLSYTASPTNGVVVSSTGTDATLPLVNTTNAGLMSPDMFDSLSKHGYINIVSGPTGFYQIGMSMSDTVMHLKAIKISVNGGTAITPTVTDSTVFWDVSATTNVTGTTNRITVATGTTTPVIDISSAYAGQNTITILGTVTTGTLSTGAIIKGVTMTLGSDASWDTYVRNASGVLTRVANGTTGQVWTATTGSSPAWITPGTGGTVTSVTGTANRITISGTATINPVVDISSAYAGQNTITILGTVATGVWNGTTIAVANGGTGQTTYTNGQLLIGNTTGNTLTKATITGTTNQLVVTNSTGSITLSLPQDVHTGATPQFLRMGIGGAASSAAGLYVQGSGYTLAGLLVSTSVSAGVSADASIATIAGTIVEPASGGASVYSGLSIAAPIITSGAGTLIDAVTVRIAGAPSAVVSGANLSLWIQSGQTRFGTAGSSLGSFSLQGSTSGETIVQASAIAGGTLTAPSVTGILMQFSEAATASSSTPTPTGNARENFLDITALATNPTFGAPTGTAANHNKIIIRVTDNGVARALAFNAIYEGSTDIPLPTTTVAGLDLYMCFLFNSGNTKWQLVGLTAGF